MSKVTREAIRKIVKLFTLNGLERVVLENLFQLMSIVVPNQLFFFFFLLILRITEITSLFEVCRVTSDRMRSYGKERKEKKKTSFRTHIVQAFFSL